MTEFKITITKEDGPRHGRYVARVEGIDAEAELTYTHRGPHLVTADHTGSPDALKGTGVAAALVDYLVNDARSNSFKVLPLCPYVRARFQKKDPEWADVLAPDPRD